MSRWQVQEAKQQLSRVIDLARSGTAGGDAKRQGSCGRPRRRRYRRLRSDDGAFKRFLADAPDFEALEIERADERARTVEL